MFINHTSSLLKQYHPKRQLSCFAIQSLQISVALLLLMVHSTGHTSEPKVSPSYTPPADGTSTLQARLAKTETLALSLEKALRIAAENNPNYKAALSVVKQAKASYLTQWAKLLPDLGVSISYLNYQGAFPLAAGLSSGQGSRAGSPSIPLASSFQLYQPQFTVSYPVFQGGDTFFQILAKRKDLAATKDWSHLTLQQTLQQTAQAYYMFQHQLDQVAIQQQQVQESQAQLDLNTARREAGAGTNLDVMQSRAQLAQAQQQLLVAKQQTESAAARLNELLDLPAIIAIMPKQVIQQQRTLLPTAIHFKQLLTIAHQNYPGIKQIKKQITALGHARNRVISGYLPQVNLQYSNGALGSRLDNTQHFEQTNLSFGLNYQNAGVSGITRFMEGSARVEEQRYRLQVQLNTLDKTVTDAFLQTVTSDGQIKSAKVQLEASKQALSDAIERLKAGVGKNIDVTDAETRLTQAKGNLSKAITDFNLAQVNLVFNLGLASVDTLTKGIPDL